MKITNEKEGVAIVKGKRKPFTDEHRKNISRACMGRKVWCEGKKMPKKSVYKNMATHIRFDVDAEWLSQFEDIEKLKLLNGCIAKRGGRFDVSTGWYKSYILKFYSDHQFNLIYSRWLESNDVYLRPTIDHIKPKSKGGGNELTNIQFLTWFENRAKNDMSQDAWDKLKSNIQDYLI